MSYYKPLFRFFRRPFKRFKLLLKQKAGWLGIPKIILYRGYGNEQEFFVRGRVVEDSGLAKPDDKQTVWHNMLATIKRFSSDEIAGVNVKTSWNGESKIATTDEYGFFIFNFKTGLIKSSAQEGNWVLINVELLDKVVENQPEITANGEVRLIFSDQARIIVSDIDDTVLVSHSTQILRKLRLMLLKNAYTRIPFEGVVEFYHSLEKGSSGKESFPFFFVSSSEWNLYDLLDDFFSYYNIPKGILLLRKLNYSIYKFWKSGGGMHEHKYKDIKFLIEFYNKHTFILIGDSGQNDPIIYKRLALEFPGSIDAIYIRKVKSKKMKIPADFSDELHNTGTHFVEIEDSYTAMQHAINRGYSRNNFL